MWLFFHKWFSFNVFKVLRRQSGRWWGQFVNVLIVHNSDSDNWGSWWLVDFLRLRRSFRFWRSLLIGFGCDFWFRLHFLFGLLFRLFFLFGFYFMFLYCFCLWLLANFLLLWLWRLNWCQFNSNCFLAFGWSLPRSLNLFHDLLFLDRPLSLASAARLRKRSYLIQGNTVIRLHNWLQLSHIFWRRLLHPNQRFFIHLKYLCSFLLCGLLRLHCFKLFFENRLLSGFLLLPPSESVWGYFWEAFVSHQQHYRTNHDNDCA